MTTPAVSDNMQIVSIVPNGFSVSAVADPALNAGDLSRIGVVVRLQPCRESLDYDDKDACRRVAAMHAEAGAKYLAESILVRAGLAQRVRHNDTLCYREVKKNVAAIIAERGPMSRRELIEFTGIDASRFNHILTEMVRCRMLVRVKTPVRKYALPTQNRLW